MTITFALTRHFVANAAGRAWLHEEGIEAMRGVFFSALAGLGSLGLFLPRRFYQQYAALGQLPDPGPYRQALVADSLFMIALPALVTALVAVLLAPAMFPDETDYATLTPLPLTRRQIFGAKVLALSALVGALVGGMTGLFAIAFPAFTHGQWAEAGRFARIGAHAGASAAGSAFAFLAVVSIQGLMLLLTPPRWLRSISATIQCAMVAALVLATPLVFRLPAQAGWISTEPALLSVVPPAWFLGLEQVLLGKRDLYFSQLALFGGIALAVAAATAGLCYAILYRNCEALVQPADRTRSNRHRRLRAPDPPGARDVGSRGFQARPWRGVWDFSAKTLRRSRLSQMLFLVAWAAGAAAAFNSLLGALLSPWFVPGEPPPRELVRAAMTMPLAMMVMAVVGLRAAFLLPVNSRANWIFRLTDFPTQRPGHLTAVDRAFVWFAIVPAIAISTPVQLYALGVATAMMSWILAALVGLLMVEIVLADWRRVPFTCTWLPGKRPLPLLVVFGLAAMLVLLFLGELVRAALYSGPGFLVLCGLLLTLAAWARRRRLRGWALHPLQFEDEPVDRLQVLGLHTH